MIEPITKRAFGIADVMALRQRQAEFIRSLPPLDAEASTEASPTAEPLEGTNAPALTVEPPAATPEPNASDGTRAKGRCGGCSRRKAKEAAEIKSDDSGNHT